MCFGQRGGGVWGGWSVPLPSWGPAIWNRSFVFLKTGAKPKLVSDGRRGLGLIFVKL